MTFNSLHKREMEMCLNFIENFVKPLLSSSMNTFCSINEMYTGYFNYCKKKENEVTKDNGNTQQDNPTASRKSFDCSGKDTRLLHCMHLDS
jgi:hypothetical protein